MPEPIEPTRQDTHLITCSIADPVSGQMKPYGIWDKWSGGDVDSEDNKYYPGGMKDPIAIGGRKTVGNVTLSRLYQLERDHPNMGDLLDGAGRVRATLQRTPLNIEGKVEAGVKPIVYNATLKRVIPPDLDSTASGPAELQLEFIIDGFPTAH